jgi:hypothetical protein
MSCVLSGCVVEHASHTNPAAFETSYKAEVTDMSKLTTLACVAATANRQSINYRVSNKSNQETESRLALPNQSWPAANQCSPTRP